MAIQFVGRASVSQQGETTGNMTLSLTALTGGIDTAARANDTVVIVWGIGAAADLAMTITTTGYTTISELYANDTNDANLEVAYKRMGTTPDTTVVFPPSGNSNYGNAALAYVFRGVNATTPIDVTSTTNTGINTGVPNAPAITPTTAGSVILVAGAASDSTMAAFTQSGTQLSNFFSIARTEQNDISVGAGTFAWTSGAFDPVVWTGGSTTTNASWAAVTLALREAVSGGPTQNLTGTVYVNPDTFGAGTVAQSTPLTGTVYVNPDTFGAGTVVPGAVTVTGTRYTDPDTFGVGTISTGGGTQSLTGTLYTDPDTFGSGTLTSALTVTGTLYTDPDTFGSGTLTGALTVTGTLYTDPDTFGAGTVVVGLSVAGTLYTDPDTFGFGTLSTAFTSVGTVYVNPDTFGPATVNYVVVGTLYADPDTFGSGAVSSSYTITGVPYTDVDTFGAGSLSSAYTASGLLYVDPDSYGAGAISGSYTITGTAYSTPNTFGSGATSTSYSIAAGLYDNPNTFGAGTVIVIGNQAIIAVAYANINLFGTGTVTNVDSGISYNPRDIAMRRLQPWKKKYKV